MLPFREIHKPRYSAHIILHRSTNFQSPFLPFPNRFRKQSPIASRMRQPSPARPHPLPTSVSYDWSDMLATMNTAIVFRGLLRGNQTDANSARGSGNEKGCLKRCLQRKRKNLILAILLAQIFANAKKVKKQAISEEIACFPQEKVVRQKGFEPPTFWFVAKHSIQLSYSRILFLNSLIMITHLTWNCKLFLKKIEPAIAGSIFYHI